MSTVIEKIETEIKVLEESKEKKSSQINENKSKLAELKQEDIESKYKKYIDLNKTKTLFTPKFSKSVFWILLAELILIAEIILKFGTEKFLPYLNIKNIGLS